MLNLLKNRESKKGVSLYLVVLILCFSTVIFLTLTSIVVSQVKMVFTISDSIISFYGADTGAERALYNIRQKNNYNSFNGNIGLASYDVNISTSTVPGPMTEVQIISGGNYRNTRRTVQLIYQY
ncbi:hypothetical protein J7J23_01005 [bacterium]|nr:hypothetical protein [bacterium]